MATAAVVGPERAVAAAAETVATERLTEALPLIQPLALSPSTRRLVKEDKELVTAVREQVQATTGADAVELFPLERIGWGQVASAFGVVFLALVAIAFISNWSDISEALSEADWSRLPLTVVLAGLTYVAGALSLMGSVLRPLPLGRTTIVMFGQSFLNRFTPMNAGGMAMRVRYLQKGGTDVAVAATAVGITSAASGVMQVVLVLLFVLAAGSSPGGAIQLPDISLVAVVVVFAALFIGLVTVIPSARRFAARWLKIVWARLGGEFKGLAGRPDKLALLFGGAGLAKLLTITCFVASCRAFGITVGFADLGMLLPDRQHRWLRRADTRWRGRCRSRPHRRPDRRRRRQRDGRGRRRHLPTGDLLAPGRARVLLPALLPKGRAGLTPTGPQGPVHGRTTGPDAKPRPALEGRPRQHEEIRRGPWPSAGRTRPG